MKGAEIMVIIAIGLTHKETIIIQDTRKIITRVGMIKPTKGMTVIKTTAAAAIIPTQNVTTTIEETTDGMRISSQEEEITTSTGGMTSLEGHTESDTIISNRDLSPEKSLLRDPLSIRVKTSKGLKLNKEAKIKMLVILNTR